MEHVEHVTLSVTVIHCDVCGVETNSPLKCLGCNRDVCQSKSCLVVLYDERFIPDRNRGDDIAPASILCRSCRAVYDSRGYHAMGEALQEAYHNALKALVAEWKGHCLAAIEAAKSEQVP